jgi:hypothetical protein
VKSRFATALVVVGLAAACSSGNPIATVGSVTITDERVDAFHAVGEAEGDFGCTLDFLISSEVFAEAARTRLGITVSGGDIDDYIEAPPPHRAAAMTDLTDADFSDEGLREQVRRWVLVDRVVDARLLADEALYAALVPADAPAAASDSPVPYLAPDDRRAVIDAWQAEFVAEDDVADVVVDPLFGSWTSDDLSARDACAAAVLARVGGVGITEADVNALNDPLFPPSPEEFIFELQFLISSELYVQEAAERFGIEVTDEEIESFIAAPPSHRITALAQFQDTGRFSRAGVEAQVRRWIVADEVVVELVAADDETLQALADAVGLGVDEVAADPLGFLSIEEANRIFNTWTTEIANAGEFAEVEVDPAVGEWDPVFRQLVPAGA